MTIDSQFIPRKELESAIETIKNIGVEPHVINADILNYDDVTGNPPDRCYFCKKKIFLLLRDFSGSMGIEEILEGTNADDAGDYRPGKKALAELGIRSPLMEAGLTKQEIRQLSREAGISTWDRPPAPCLATRFPYGTRITEEGISRIEKAEELIHSMGIDIVRVRDHGNIARIEVPDIYLPKIIDRNHSGEIIVYFKELGFQYVTLDIQGYRMGSMNEVLVRDKING